MSNSAIAVRHDTEKKKMGILSWDEYTKAVSLDPHKLKHLSNRDTFHLPNYTDQTKKDGESIASKLARDYFQIPPSLIKDDVIEILTKELEKIKKKIRVFSRVKLRSLLYNRAKSRKIKKVGGGSFVDDLDDVRKLMEDRNITADTIVNIHHVMYDEITRDELESIAADVARTIGIEVVHGDGQILQ
ncbi:unknown protein [Seminavis robusta]|uniref:Uncharacterized protein n=1 Tax=Seminavis robusta TaxID=568900 RepID=A0A9N8F2S0_9STRA|nr:unknown protein [Seminavis robusta]|eukprot:Sro2899_g339730.1 n/a (187) ;mRNA; f:6416-6976